MKTSTFESIKTKLQMKWSIFQTFEKSSEKLIYVIAEMAFSCVKFMLYIRGADIGLSAIDLAKWW